MAESSKLKSFNLEEQPQSRFSNLKDVHLVDNVTPKFLRQILFSTLARAIALFQSLPNFHDHTVGRMEAKTVLKIQKIESFAFYDNSRFTTTELGNFALLHLPCQFGYSVLYLAFSHLWMQPNDTWTSIPVPSSVPLHSLAARTY